MAPDGYPVTSGDPRPRSDAAPHSPWLAQLDARLRRGAQAFSPAFSAAQVNYVLSLRQPDGGFPGRRGGSDLYYTDFALRTLALLAPGHEALRSAAAFLATAPPPSDLVHTFSLLNCSRLLGLPAPLTSDRLAALSAAPIAGGATGLPFGLTRTFIAAMCRQMLGQQALSSGEIAAIRSLRRPDGGFADTADQPLGQTNATVAAIALLSLAGDARPDELTAARRFLAAMQTACGGLRAHPAAPEPDLLSTFHALVVTMDTTALRLQAVARFVRALALPDGGFRGTPTDPAADLEYTYYGLACLALLRVAARRSDAGGEVIQ